jgi:HSP20 family protein
MLVRHDPWSLVNRLHGDLDRLLQTRTPAAADSDDHGTVTDWVPAVDIKEEAERFVIQADVPGVKADDIEITMEDGVLTLRGTRNTEAREDDNGFRRIERVRGQFFRRFTLPDTADAEAIEASFKDGVLAVVIPKLPQVQPRRITVKVN